MSEEHPRGQDEIDQLGDIGEDLPERPLPKKGLPPINPMEPDEDLVNIPDTSKGMEEALKQIEQYEEGVPKHDPNSPRHEEC